MDSKNTSSFSKYKEYGAYHWAVFSRDPRRHDLFTYARYQVVLDNTNIKDAMTVLDIGCGDGALTYMFWKQNPNIKITGIEPEPVGRSLAKEMFRKKNASAAFLESSTLVPDESQDIVICADVIEHVRDPEGLVAEISRILKPGGRAVISTPVRLTESPWDKEHVREFFPEEFHQLIEKYFTMLTHEFSSSVFSTELYSWKPRIFFNRPIIGWFMSLLNIWFGINLMRNFNPAGLLWHTQIVNAVKP